MLLTRLLKSRLLLLPTLFVLPVLLGLLRYWHATRVGPKRHFQAALEAFAQNDLDGVQVAAEALHGVSGHESHLRLLSGMVLLRTGQLYDAIAEFGRARQHPDTQALAHTLSGEALYKSRQFKDARRILATALQLDPTQTDARRWLAAMYYDIGAMNHAIGHLRVVAEQAPADPRPHRLIGLIHKDFEEYQKAVGAYRESLKRDPDQPEREILQLELAECLVKQQRHEEALETLRDCPRLAQTLWMRAKCYHALRDNAAARKLVDEAIQLDPNHLDAMQLKATLELEANNAALAVEIMEKAVKRYPKEWRPRHVLARGYRRLGEVDKSVEHSKVMEQLRELRYRFTKLHAQAMEDAENAEVRYELGIAAKQLDKSLLAVSWLEAALALDPDHRHARNALQELTREGPDADAAKEGRRSQLQQ